MEKVADFFFWQSNQPDFFFGNPKLSLPNNGGETNRLTNLISELETQEVNFLQKFIDLYILKLKPHDKIQNRTTFYFLSPILSPPHFVPTMCGGFYAKFQDSGIKSKKSPQHSVANSRLAIFATVCIK